MLHFVSLDWLEIGFRSAVLLKTKERIGFVL